MENFWIVATQVGILFVLMGAGACCRLTKLVDAKSIKGIVNVLILLVTPCLIIHCFQRPYDPAMMKGLGVSFAFALGAHVVSILLANLLVRNREEKTRCVLRLASVFSNAGFMGVPLEQAILGETGVFYGITFVVVFNLFIWSWGLAVMRGGAARASRTMFVNPGTIGIALGLGLFLTSWQLPEIVRTPVKMLSDLNTPLAMVVIGYYLGGMRLAAVVRSPSAWVATALRLVVVPLLATAALYPFRHSLDRTMMLATVIPAAAPVAAMVTMFAAKFDRDVNMSVGMVCGTTLLSILTMPPVIAFAMSVLSR